MSAETQSSYRLDPLSPSETVESRVYAQLRRAIVEGLLPPGERLVLTRMASELGVSRVPVTQALKRLETEGFVRTNDRNDIVVVRLTANEVWEVYTLRAHLQALAARLAAERSKPGQMAEIERIAEEVAESMRSGQPTNDRHFHAAIADACEMPRLSQMLNNLWDHTEVYRAALDADFRRLEQEKKKADHTYSAQDHAELVAALKAGDGKTAAAVEERHVLHSMERILALPVIHPKT